MKTLLLTALFLIGCGYPQKTVIKRTSGNCSVSSNKEYAVVSCPDGSYHVFALKDKTTEKESIVVVNECNVRQNSSQDADTRNTTRQTNDQDTRQDNK